MKAFPTPTFSISEEARVTSIGGEGGMELRDYFAAKAMQTREWFYFADPEANEFQLQTEAKHCYMVADAMMKAREL